MDLRLVSINVIWLTIERIPCIGTDLISYWYRVGVTNIPIILLQHRNRDMSMEIYNVTFCYGTLECIKSPMHTKKVVCFVSNSTPFWRSGLFYHKRALMNSQYALMCFLSSVERIPCIGHNAITYWNLVGVTYIPIIHLQHSEPPVRILYVGIGHGWYVHESIQCDSLLWYTQMTL